MNKYLIELEKYNPENMLEYISWILNSQYIKEFWKEWYLKLYNDAKKSNNNDLIYFIWISYVISDFYENIRYHQMNEWFESNVDTELKTLKNIYDIEMYLDDEHLNEMIDEALVFIMFNTCIFINDLFQDDDFIKSINNFPEWLEEYKSTYSYFMEKKIKIWRETVISWFKNWYTELKIAKEVMKNCSDDNL